MVNSATRARLFLWGSSVLIVVVLVVVAGVTIARFASEASAPVQEKLSSQLSFPVIYEPDNRSAQYSGKFTLQLNADGTALARNAPFGELRSFDEIDCVAPYPTPTDSDGIWTDDGAGRISIEASGKKLILDSSGRLGKLDWAIAGFFLCGTKDYVRVVRRPS